MNKKTNKTAHVLKLLTNNDEAIRENPILNEEFKDEMIHRRPHEEKKAEIKPVAKSETLSVPKAVGINIISELVSENLLPVLERFRCCTCEICKAEITVAALNQIPPQYAYLTNGSFDEVNALKEANRPKVVPVLIKLAIQLKNKPIHK